MNNIYRFFKIVFGMGIILLVLGNVSQAKTGKQVYTENCSLCHSSNSLGAPKIQDAKAWKKVALKTKISMSTIKNRKKLIKVFLKQAKKGIAAMPVKGNCTNCTDAELKAAIKYMVPKKLSK